MAFEDDFVNSYQVCITENCKNYSLKFKDTCKSCTEVKTLRLEIKELHDHLYELEEHIVNLETNQVDEQVRRKALKYINEKGSEDVENTNKEPQLSEIDNEVTSLPDNIEKRLKEIENLFRKGIDEKIELAIHRNLDKKKQTYASVLSSNQENEIKTANQALEYSRSNTSNEEISRRSKNVIVYKLEECEDIVADQERIQKFLHQVNINSTSIKTYRLGRKTESKMTRPVKIIFDNAEDAEETLRRSIVNRRSTELENVHIRKDYSSEERDLIRAMVQEAKAKNSNEATEGVQWKVRGCPRSNLHIEAIQIRAIDQVQKRTARS